MKRRNGFVSNSSSTSYVVCLPDKDPFASMSDKEFFALLYKSNIDELLEGISDGELSEEEEEKKAVEEVRRAIKQLCDGGYIDFNYGDEYSCGMSPVLQKLLEEYIIYSYNSGSDCESMSSVNNKKMFKVVEKVFLIKKED